MPELPEVETVVRDLRPLVCGRKITTVAAGPKRLRVPWRREWNARIIGKRVEGIRRRGKWLIFELNSGGYLLAHLGMTGQFSVTSTAAPHESHTHLVIGLAKDRELRFRDIRRFGNMRYCASEAEVNQAIGERFGPEPWDVVTDQLHHALRGSRRNLKALLLDQTMIAGIGNIYADESLHMARLSPKQTGSKTTREQTERLRLAIIRVLEQAIASRGSTIRNYVGGSGLQGEHQIRLLVYGRTGEPCTNCGKLIQCTRLAGRSTHWCPNCQKPGRQSRR
jgi:formamidopyrimidine-DNA glycosylase